MAAKGADSAVAAGAKRLGAEELATAASMLIRQYDPELYQVAQSLHLMSDEEKWGKLKSLAKKGFNAAKGYVNKNKGKWMKQAAGAAKGWYNKQGKKVLGK